MGGRNKINIKFVSNFKIMDVQKGSRLTLPDVLKGLAVLLMIQVHLTELFAVPFWLNSKAGQWSLFLGGAPAAPLFMAVMGYFLAKKQPTIMQAMKRGLRLISWGLMLNVGLNMHLLIKIAAG
ncbi:heparan-alpha-glucosaminide N-acetyltransferase domain-containing protein, partial [Arthrospira platensis SPKY1]|nr:heparan-alpha-glucosaminide N-acetyltransferase domain-containing protein [Arthrospira platensis SPKY1]